LQKRTGLAKAAIYAAVLIAMFVASTTLFARKKDQPRLDHLCGVIDHVQYVPVREHINTFNDRRTPLPSLPLIFYQQQAGQSCCDGLKQVAATITDKNGKFDLVEVKFGHYWLSTEWSKKTYKYAFDYPFSNDPEVTCSRQGIDLKDDGSVAWWVTITVD
jgi:hypothetical protein